MTPALRPRAVSGDVPCHLATAALAREHSPPGKNQSACWMMGSMTATTCTEVAAAISASVLQRRPAGSQAALGGLRSRPPASAGRARARLPFSRRETFKHKRKS